MDDYENDVKEAVSLLVMVLMYFTAGEPHWCNDVLKEAQKQMKDRENATNGDFH